MNIVRIFFSLSILLLSCTPLKKVAVLDPLLAENSGLLYVRNTGIWVHNDGDNAAAIYQLDSLGQIQRAIKIGLAYNTDWEDITQDQKGNIYIGDFGNNLNVRGDLCIYKIPPIDSIVGDSVNAQRIGFIYPQQRTFPPDKRAMHYDVEAMVAFNDSLFLFTKNRSKPMNGYVRLYRLPARAGEHLEAELIDSLKLPQISKYQSVTGAAISPDGQHLALLSMGKLRIFSDFEGSNFFGARHIRQKNLKFTQKEAVTFKNSRTLYLSDEKSPLGKAKLYELRLRR